MEIACEYLLFANTLSCAKLLVYTAEYSGRIFPLNISIEYSSRILPRNITVEYYSRIFQILHEKKYI